MTSQIAAQSHGNRHPLLKRAAVWILAGISSIRGFVTVLEKALDMIGRGQVATDLYSHLPKINAILANPVWPIIVFPASIYWLWRQDHRVKDSQPIGDAQPPQPETSQPTPPKATSSTLKIASYIVIGSALLVLATGIFIEVFVHTSATAQNNPSPAAPSQAQNPPPTSNPRTQTPGKSKEKAHSWSKYSPAEGKGNAQNPPASQPIGQAIPPTTTTPNSPVPIQNRPQNPLPPSSAQTEPLRLRGDGPSVIKEAQAFIDQLGELNGEWQRDCAAAVTPGDDAPTQMIPHSGAESARADWVMKDKARRENELISAENTFSQQWAQGDYDAKARAIHEDAIDLMTSVQPKLTIEEKEKNQGRFNQALKMAATSLQNDKDIHALNYDQDRFQRVINYFTDLIDSLKKYPENP